MKKIIMGGIIVVALCFGLWLFISLQNVNSQKNMVQFAPTFHYQLQNAKYEDLKNLPVQMMVVDIDDVQLTPEEIEALHQQGKKVLSYLSIGEAEDYRNYWKESWKVSNPSFVDEENPAWKGNYKVKFWDKEWKQIIFDRVKKIQEAGYDGVYLDIIDAYEYYQEQGKKDADMEMVLFVSEITLQAKQRKHSFLIVPQNAPELYTLYQNTIDGMGVEDLFYNDDEPQDTEETKRKLMYLRQAHFRGKFILSIDYPTSQENICDFYKKCAEQNFLCMVSNRDLSQKQGKVCNP